MKVEFVNIGLQFTSIEKELLPKITEVLKSGHYILGEELKTFEKNFANYCETKYAVGVADGTDAMILSMHALGIGRGDEVITATNSFIASAGAIEAVGAKPVFVDVKDDYNIDPELIEEAITPKTKAILPIHLTGRPAAMDEILSIAKKHNLFVIEDAAQAVGSKYKGKKVGSLGNVGCFSLHPLKNLGCCGDGGVITTNDEKTYKKLIELRNHGLINRDECDSWGFNSRLDNVQAAILNVRLKYLDKNIKRIKKIAKVYQENLKDIVQCPVDKNYEDCAYHNFVVLVKNREKIMKYLLDKGVETKIHYPIPIHLQEAAKNLNYKEGDFPNAELQSKQILSLPIYPELTDEEVKYVIDQIKNYFEV